MKTHPSRVLALAAATALLATLLLALQSPVDAVVTRSFVLDDAESLAAGELDGTAAHSDGSVTAGAEVRRIALDDAAAAWCFARAADGSVYIGTANDGKIYRLRGDDLSLFADTQQLLVSAITFGEGNTLYAGTLPEGRIYRIDATGQVTELTRPEGADHVWALVWDARRRTLFAATGPDGKVFAIDTQGRAEVFYDSAAAHVMSLALDADGALYAGTSDDALVVRLRGPGRAEVVFDFPGNEITALAARDGTLAVAANEFASPPSGGDAATKTATKNKTAGATRPRPGKGRLWRVTSDGNAEQIYENTDGHFTSVQLAADGTVFAGSGKDGRIYRVAADRTSSTWIDVDERQVLAIDLTGSDPIFVTGDGAAVYRVVPGRPQDAIWTSKALDAQFLARFGELTWRAEGALQLQTRSGNAREPDETWSDWSAPVTTPGPIRSPSARYLQIRARFPQNADAVLRAVVAYYLPQNQRAVVTQVGFKAPAESKNKNAGGEGEPPAASTKYRLSWKIDNPDHDALRFRLRFRQESQRRWREVLRESEILTDEDYTWETSGIPDGWYVVRVEASDELANPEDRTLRVTADSEPLLIDNHAPVIEGLRATGLRVGGRVVDALGPIAKLEYAVDGGEWRIFFPADDLLDTATERFDLDLGSLAAGEHIVAVRATDAGGNVASAETTVTAPPAPGR